MATSASQQNPNISNPPKLREDGELSSSDDDVLPRDSITQTISMSGPPSSVPNATVTTSRHIVNSGKSSSVNISGGPRNQSKAPAYRQGFSKNQMLLKPSNSAWCNSGLKDNLVISFSDDDDSGSDGEGKRQEKALAAGRLPPVNRSQKPPSLPHVKRQNVRKNLKDEGKFAPKKLCSSRTFVSSMSKIHGSRSRTGGSSLAEQGSSLKNSEVAVSMLASQDPGCSKNMDVSCSKLQDLRQKIAMRENELKLKIMQQNKESDVESSRKVNPVEHSQVSTRKCKAVPADVRTEFDAKEPDRKRLKSDATGVTVSCSLSDWISKPRGILPLSKQTVSLTNGTPVDTSDNSHSGMINKNQPSRSAPNQDTQENNMNKANDRRDAVSVRGNVKFKSDSNLKAGSSQVSDGKFESPDASLENTDLLHCLGASGFPGTDVDLQSLFELEELHDKELEEAQEQRRRCEEEELNALKAYRKAQRALAEANARCTHLYSRRELYSARLSSFLMENPSLYSSGQHIQLGEKWNFADNVSEVNLALISSSQRLNDGFEAPNQLGYESNAHSADGDAHNRFSANEEGHNLGSEACSEPDASTSELVRGNNSVANGFNPPSSDPNFSPDDDYEAISLDNRSLCANVTRLPKEDNFKESEKHMDIDSTTNFSTDPCQDSLLLEEYLRSKLVSRLGASSLRRRSSGVEKKLAAERVAEQNVVCTKDQIMVDSVSLSEPNVLTIDCGESVKESESSMLKPLTSAEKQQCANLCSDQEDSGFCCMKVPLISIFKGAMKAVGPVSLGSKQIEEHQYGSPVICNGDRMLITESQDELSLETNSLPEQCVKFGSFDRIDSYNCGSTVNPFWPLCMYELRGRCNNEECPWQHAKDYSSRNVDQSDSSGSNDCQTVRSCLSLNQRGSGEFSSVLTPPTYLVCLDSLEDKSYKSGSLQARHFVSSQKNIFSHTLAVSSSLLEHIPSNEPCLHGNGGCVESYSGSGHSLYFKSRKGTGNPLQNFLADYEQSLEVALIMLRQEVNKLEGMKKALSVLSRALESDPASLHLWIIYLLLFYSTKNKVGVVCRTFQEDDFFSHAVKHNEKSYELWLLYINSRKQLNERFTAYERALSRLCHHVSADDGHAVLISAAILDLFLQMLHCFCVSGNVAMAVQKIHELFPTDRDFDESHSLLFSDILQCLTISDKCVFWVCCVYLVIYRKLPDLLVQQFEFQKDISLLEWPSIRLTLEEKQHVYKLTNMAVESVGLCLEGPVESNTLKLAEPLVVNNIKIMAATADMENCTMYLEKYKVAYSSCLEFVLLAARTRCLLSECTNCEGFEEALSNWPQDAPGSHCIWNQYAEYALEMNRPDRAKEIMDQWFNSAWKPQFDHLSVDAETGDCNKSIPLDSTSGLNTNALISCSSRMDSVFGLLNLSLYKLFQNEVLEAHLALEKALKVADDDVLRHCVTEHAAFLFNNGSKLGKDVSTRGLLGILKGYTIHSQAIPAPEPLPRKFIQGIKKPQSRQVVSNILNPLLPDCILVNAVLETWFGSSLLPQKFDELKDMVDFVEAILEFSPANYQLVISACKLVSRDSGSCNAKYASVLFWASSLLVNTVYQAVPVPPEYVWVEAADLLVKLTNVQEILDSFHQRALTMFPFSIRLWRSYLSLSMDSNKKSSAVEEARQKGLEID